jgi:hypothetical protein
MVGLGLVCSAGARSFGAGREGASAGRRGGKGGAAAVDALEACSWKASIAVIMKNARMPIRATQAPWLISEGDLIAVEIDLNVFDN